MPFDPTLPKNSSQILSGELRDQFNGLKELIDAQQQQINDQQQQINSLRPVAPALEADSGDDVDRLTLSKTVQPTRPDEWLGWKSDTGIGNPDTHPSEWQGPLGWDMDNSDDTNWVIEWDGCINNNYFIAAYRVGNVRSQYSNVAHP